jgi:hypothetical protein
VAAAIATAVIELALGRQRWSAAREVQRRGGSPSVGRRRRRTRRLRLPADLRTQQSLLKR